MLKFSEILNFLVKIPNLKEFDRAGGRQAQPVPAGEEPARGAYPLRGGSSGTVRVGSPVIPAAARAGGGTAPLGRARARDV